MKQLQKISSFILLFALLGFEINAQTIQTVTPSNVTQSATEIKNIFGDLIGVSVADIEYFLNHHWTDDYPYGSSCQAPAAELTSMNSSEVLFDWTFGGGAPPDEFRVSSLRLSDGIQQTTTTDDNSIALNLPKGLHLVVFQSNCSSARSALDIIIIERIMFFTDCDCDCRDFYEIWTQRFSSTSGIQSHEWNPGSLSNQYFYEISYDLPVVMTASFKAEIEFVENTPVKVHLDMNSMHNFELNSDETFIFAQPDETENFLGAMTFAQNPDSENEAPVLSYNPINDVFSPQEGNVTLYECKDKPRSRENTGALNLESTSAYSLKEISNSFESFKTIEYHLPADKSVSIYLLDSQGRFIKTIVNHTNKTAGSYQENLDLSTYPNGTYLCILKTDQKVVPLKVLKTK